MISSSCHGVNEIFALLQYYTTFIASYHVLGQPIGPIFTFKTGPIDCPGTSGTTNQLMLHNIPEE
jgi:hypothetical protein